MKTIGFIVGSLRKGSYNRKIAAYLAEQLPAEYESKFLDIAQLPLYNEELDTAAPPEAWKAFRAEVEQMDAFVFVTPEYNRSIPAALKNALDVASRPSGKNLWRKKPGAVISASPGGVGGFGANHHLRQSMVCLDMFMLAQPEMYLGSIASAFDENGNLVNERTISFLQKFGSDFISWVKQFEK